MLTRQLLHKRQVLNYVRFFSPSRSGLEGEEKEISYTEKENFLDANWIRVEDTVPLANVSSAAFSFAYSLADQIHYPVGIVDLGNANSTILNWISDKSIDNLVAVSDYLKDLGLYLSESAYEELLESDRAKVEAMKISTELEKERKNMDFDLAKADRLDELQGQDETLELDFPNSKWQSEENKGEVLSSNATKALDFKLLGQGSEPKPKGKLNKELEAEIPIESRICTMYRSKLYPLRGMTIRGMVYCPNGKECNYVRNDLLLMALLQTLADTFEPKLVEDNSAMPSLICLASHPGNVDFDNPYRVLEFNENVSDFLRRLTMPTGVVNILDLLLQTRLRFHCW